MNKVIYISVLIFGLALVSCSKQDISPVNDEPVVVPAWGMEKDGSAFGSDFSGDLDDSDESSPGDITDPNNDPDGKTKGK